ncbi:MAG: cyclic nucleotide-binding domain-containing protein [Desulfobacterium sp.]|nr:cyclic nucleotide-binding domain-containing protein [Desulfobacterium sp.]
MTDDMLDELSAITIVIKAEKGTVIYKEGDAAQNVYMLKSGKILLEQKISNTIAVTVNSIDPGESFGWAFLLDRGSNALTASCCEDSEIYVINRDLVRKLMDEDNSIGYMMMKQLATVLKRRLDQRTIQFLKSVKSHPDITALEEC